MGKLKILSLSSGGGSTFQRVAEACQKGEIDGQVVGLICNNKSAGCLQKAQTLEVPSVLLRLNADFGGNLEAFGEAILKIAIETKADLIAQLGWLPLTPQNVIRAFVDMIINQHPGPLDPGRLGFGGKGMHGKAVHAAVVYFSQKVNRKPFYTEATVHRVTEKVDEGTLLGVRQLQVLSSDNAESLASRLLPLEHELVVETLLQFASGVETEIFRRHQPLILPGEEAWYYEAIEAGKKQYPNG